MSATPWPTRVAFVIYLASLAALAAVAALAALDGRLGEATLAALCLTVGAVRPRVDAFAAPGVALLGAWLVGALAFAVALAAIASSYAAPSITRRRPTDVAALSTLVTAVPEDVVYAARVVGAEAPLSTWHLVSLAARGDPALWRPALGRDPGPAAWDGPVLELGEAGAVTQFFAEAAGLGAEIARRRERELDRDLLALAACVTPLSAAEEWSDDIETVAEQILEAPLFELVACQAAFSNTTAGRDLTRRVEILSWANLLSIEDRERVFELEVGVVPRLLRTLLS